MFTYEELIARYTIKSSKILQEYSNFYQTYLKLLSINIHHQSCAKEIIAQGKVGQLKFFESLATDKASPTDIPSIVIVPSIINKSDILDIKPSHSLCASLSKEANVYLIDWYNLSADSSLELYIKDIIFFIEMIAKRDQQKISLIGYCLGGNLASASYFHCSSQIEKIVLIATPWDFSQLPYRPPNLSGLEMEFIPAGLISLYLNQLNIEKIIDKYTYFHQKALSEEQLDLFLRVEYWANNGLNLPITVARVIIQELFEENKTMLGNWQVMGKIIDASKIEVPTLVISTDNDKIVTRRSASTITKFLPQSQLVETSFGHVGVIISRKAKYEVWDVLSKFLLSKELV